MTHGVPLGLDIAPWRVNLRSGSPRGSTIRGLLTLLCDLPLCFILHPALELPLLPLLSRIAFRECHQQRHMDAAAAVTCHQDLIAYTEGLQTCCLPQSCRHQQDHPTQKAVRGLVARRLAGDYWHPEADSAVSSLRRDRLRVRHPDDAFRCLTQLPGKAHGVRLS